MTSSQFSVVLNPRAPATAPWSMLIRALRQDMGQSQEQFARALGVSVVTVSRWERGKAAPRAWPMVEAVARLVVEHKAETVGLP